MYRSIAWKSLQKKATLFDEDVVASIAWKTKIELVSGESEQLVFVDGENITNQLKKETISRGAAIVAAQPIIREIMTAKQRKLGKQGKVVMDGRDIGTVVFPNAEIKIFMTADDEVRAKRRYDELTQSGVTVTMKEVRENINARDYKDTHRKESPLLKADDAITLDNTHISPEEQLDFVLKQIASRFG